MASKCLDVDLSRSRSVGTHLSSRVFDIYFMFAQQVVIMRLDEDRKNQKYLFSNQSNMKAFNSSSPIDNFVVQLQTYPLL